LSPAISAKRFRLAASAASGRNGTQNRSPVPAFSSKNSGIEQPSRPRPGYSPQGAGKYSTLSASPTIGLDEAAIGRAEAAFAHEFAKWQGAIDAALADPSLSPDRRAAAVRALRIRQQAEANGVRKQVLDEEVQKAQAAQRARRSLKKDEPSP
jgi:hypothetical protein